MKSNERFTERDADDAVGGRVPASPELADVQHALSLMREALTMEPTNEEVSAQATRFAAAVPSPTSAPHAQPSSPWRRRVAAVVAVLAVSGFGVAGAAAANEAAPGDPMYRVDKALERVGILDGGTEERLDEAQVLLNKDDVERALELATDALESDGQVQAATGLRNAALAVAKNSSGDDVRARVSEMLQWMAGQDTRGADFGAAVSERARQLSGNANANANANKGANENANENANDGDNKGINEDASENANKGANENANAHSTDKALDKATENANKGANENANAKTASAPGQSASKP